MSLAVTPYYQKIS